ncbi:GMC oxidoreductase [Elsinoe ampelina]|uniref:GMC oxidoreductase n=1 Tax=Elsinoe ampelina TaxID=302913 RepID=A0A6A6GNB4_9PEZI|nr:GMC oxidoreductase [Elsinoe ampelina]
MRSTLAGAATVSLLLSTATASPLDFKSFSDLKTALLSKKDVAKKDTTVTYDYIVVGGGASGLTVANRLSEDKNINVLVIEAGQLDQKEDYIMVPGLAGTGTGTKYDWNISYVPNAALNNRAVPVAQGLGVGGGTLLNRLLMDRGSSADYNRWPLVGASGWDWNGLFPFFKKSENYTPPNADVAKDYNITYNQAYHGTGGPIQNSHSPYVWPTLKNYILGHRELGAKTPADAAGGDAVGVYAITHCQNPKDATRDSARTAYHDKAAGRSNYKLLTGTRVTKLTSKGNTITGVEIAAGPDAPRQTILAKKEVIMAAGAIRTPHILKLSGIGDPAELKKFNIPVVAANTAVGQNLQDHVLLPVVFGITAELTTNKLSDPTFSAQALAEWRAKGTGPYSTATADYLAFLSAQLISPGNWTKMALSLATQSPDTYLDASAPASVRAGYAIQKGLLAKGFLSSQEAVMEIIWADGVVLAALQHPASRGTVKLASANPFDTPLADAAHLKNPVDMQLMVETVKYIRRFMATNAMKPLSPVEYVPGAAAADDAAITEYIKNGAGTVWHPVGSCHIGAQSLGGCVDTNLKVYGVNNLRVVDASTMPIMPATHIMSTVYAMAEKAADIIS